MSSCKLYRQVPDSDTDFDTSSRAMANLGNRLLRAFRFIEAYDYYSLSLSFDPINDIALTGAARVLLYYANSGIGNEETLRAAAAEHLKKVDLERLRQLAGQRAVDALRPMVESHSTGGATRTLPVMNDYQKFVSAHRLALSPTIDDLDLNVVRWDSLHIRSYADTNSDPTIPDIFAMFNVLKSEYLAARQLAFHALNSTLTETGNYIDTLDYSVYGVNQAALTTAQRITHDVLDKIAVASAAYLGLPDKVKTITFRTLWFTERDGIVTNWKDMIREEIESNNTALVALSELALDVRNNGFLYQIQDRRNTSTHRFTILYDFGIGTEGSQYLDRVLLKDFEKQLIETLQIARSALFYFVEMIRQHEEHKIPEGTRVVRLMAPDHDYIRGRDDNRTL